MCGALVSPDLLPSYSVIILASHNTVILIITNPHIFLLQEIREFDQDSGMHRIVHVMTGKEEWQNLKKKPVRFPTA